MCVEEEAEAMTFVCETDAVCPAKYVAILLKRLVTDYGVFWMPSLKNRSSLGPQAVLLAQIALFITGLHSILAQHIYT